MTFRDIHAKANYRRVQQKRDNQTRIRSFVAFSPLGADLGHALKTVIHMLQNKQTNKLVKKTERK